MSECYIGRLPCGCVVAATVIDGQDFRQLAKDVSQFIQEGLTIERVSSEYVKEHLRSCIHQSKELEDDTNRS